MQKISFASDNFAGVHPDIMQAISEANAGPAKAYGDDIYTRAAVAKFKSIFGKDCAIFFVCNGTAANVTGISSFIQPYHAVICSDLSHLQVDECGAIENYIGCKLLLVPHENGKINLDRLPKYLERLHDQHHVQPKIISITQATEYGTVYAPTEVKALADFAHQNNMFLHMDGARLCNATAGLKTTLSALTFESGVDILSFGGTKAGMMFGEAVIFAHDRFAKDFLYIRKQGMQLLSKMRFLSAQFTRLLQNDLWFQLATHANEMAQQLKQGLSQFPQLKITKPVEANAVFVTMPQKLIEVLQARFDFYVWNKSLSEVRLMTSFASVPAEIDSFITHIQQYFAG